MHRWIPILLLGLCAWLMLLAGCDYPQEGYYALVGKDADGKAVLRLPFAVEEQVDDTEMTTGYDLLLPAPIKNGTPNVVEVQVQNGTDLTRRSWECAIAAADTRAGDVLIDLTHAEERMSFVGGYRPNDFSPVVQLAAELFPGATGDSNRIEFITNQPKVPGGDGVTQWELASIEQKSFEQAIGGPLKGAKRNKAATLEQGFLDAAHLAAEVLLEQQTTEVANADATAQPSATSGKPAAKPKLKPSAKPKQPPTLGGRNRNRPH